MRILILALFLICATAHDETGRLNIFIRRYEPLYHRAEVEHRRHTRPRRSIDITGRGEFTVKLRSSKRIQGDANNGAKDLKAESTDGALGESQGRLYYKSDDYEDIWSSLCSRIEARSIHTSDSNGYRKTMATMIAFNCHFAAYRVLHLRLSADTSVFHEDLVVESSTEGIIRVNTSHIYRGSLVGEPGSHVFGSLHDGVFEGTIQTSSGDSLYVERAARFFNDSRPFHSVLYSSADIDLPAHGGGVRHCGLHGKTEKWMNDVLRRFRRKPQYKEHRVSQSLVGRRLQAVTDASADGDKGDLSRGALDNDLDSSDDGSTLGDESSFGETKHEVAERGEHGEYEDSYESDEPKKKGLLRRRTSLSRRLCNLEVTADYTLFEKVLQQAKSLTVTRQLIVDYIATMVQTVNTIYGNTSFGGIEDIHFVVQHLVINEPSDCVGYKRSKNPLCSQALDAAHTLYILSLVPRDHYCLSYLINYRDFMDGTLGLAWIASNDGSGGLCERYRNAVEEDPATKEYKQAKLSLNTGITTVINFHKYVGSHVAALTLAHEIGHSFGSPHDSGTVCDPSGPEGKYLMFESATLGKSPNNNRFSLCSIRNISSILVPFLAGKTDREDCLLRSTGPICGNLIVEGDEECDCGLDDAECSDRCCHPRRTADSSMACRLKKSARCSPTAGSCCTADCKFVAKGTLCSERTDCTENSYCDHPCTGQKAKCPKATPKPNMTSCNADTQVCRSGECTGSICEKYGFVECYRGAGRLTEEEQCLLTCQEHGSSQCKVACDFSEMKSHCGAKLQPGSPCDSLRGYCDVFFKCRSVKQQSFLTSPSGFFLGGEPFTLLYEFIAHHPFSAGLVILGSSWLTLFVIRCFALHTPSNNPTKKAALRLKDTLQNPMKALVNN